MTDGHNTDHWSDLSRSKRGPPMRGHLASALLALVAVFSLALSTSAAKSNKVVQEDRVIAGGPDVSAEVRHILLRGTNEQIGKALTEIAIVRYGVRLERASDPDRVCAMRKFLERNDPILLDRMRGVAGAFGKS